MARDREITVADLLKEVISPLVEGDGRVVVLRLPEETWSSFAAFFEDESVECAMARCLGADADDFARATRQA
jgi:predicted DNA-binding protein with PD1-like motif